MSRKNLGSQCQIPKNLSNQNKFDQKVDLLNTDPRNIDDEKVKDNIPVEFGHSRAKSSNRISLSQFMVLVCILNICVLLSKSGRPNSTLRSNRPGRSSAGSRVSGLEFVDKET